MIAAANRSHRSGEMASARVSDDVYESGFSSLRQRCRADGLYPPSINTVIVDATLHAFIEHFEQGLVVADGNGLVHFLNRAAEAFIRAGLLRLDVGCLRGSTSSDTTALRKLIAYCAVSGRGASGRLISGDGMLLVAACATPATVWPTSGTAVLLRFVDPTTTRLPDSDTLQAQFEFTPTEAALAHEIMAGNDLAASAARRRITLNTARAHLRRIFDKTETRRQAALMRLLLLCPRSITAERSTAP